MSKNQQPSKNKKLQGLMFFMMFLSSKSCKRRKVDVPQVQQQSIVQLLNPKFFLN